MSLFGSIVGNIVANRAQRAVAHKVGDVIGDKIDQAIGTPDGTYGQTGAAWGQPGGYTEGAPTQPYNPGVPAQPYNPGTPNASEPTKNRAWFANVLATSFAGYPVRENVSPSEFGGPADARKYDFVVYSGATPKAAIVLPTNNRSNAYRAAKSTAEGAGIAFLPFWLTMWNRQDYVVNRIGAAL